ncbi:hypothetical protein ACCO45_013668 [Purpureocillium lilacinum]|uniref:Uncharacterized protein n=1 Tax=Purpureocillium lilacinum TaxID=33203 RepID=A0ACC4D6W1_PURLI
MSSNVEQAEAPHQAYDTILTLDFGSQVTHLITRRLRELNVYSEMLPCTTKLADLPFKPKGIILSGGPNSVYEKDAPHADPAFFELGVPILGICYGLQEIGWRLSKDNVIAGTEREYGYAELVPHRHNSNVDRLFEGLHEKETQVWMSHGDKLGKLPEGFVTIATTQNSPYAGIAHETKPIFGLQFHPEVTHSLRGKDMLKNFAVGICGAKANWNMSNFIDQEIVRIRKLVGDKAQVIGAVSGGVDSTVAAKLMKEAIGDRFHAVLVDNGVMRLNECKQVKETLQEHLGINLTVVDASQKFLGGLKGVEDPEKKRKFIGNTFIDIFEEEAVRIEKAAENTPNAGKVEWFLQGTLYPDVIESISFKGPSSTIKTHHNVGGLPQRMMDGQGLKLIEPLRELFKDEVRALGRQLGINEELVMRHPFPGPGIAIRIIGEVTPERVEIARKADHIFIGMIKEAGLYNKISQAYAGLLTNKMVGVMGDKREEGYIISLRAVVTTDFMTADAYPFDMEFVMKVARRIVNEVEGVANVEYNVTGKPPGTIEMQYKRYSAFDSHLDQDALAEARSWYQSFDASQLPKGNTTYARSSGPGGQHVNKTETKATTVYPVQELLSVMPSFLHGSVRASKYYTASNDALTFQAQTHRSRTANVDENRRKLMDEVTRLYQEKTPAETSAEKKSKYQEVEKRFHEERIKHKKKASAKKQSRRGPPE